MFSYILLSFGNLCSPGRVPLGRRVTSTGRPLAVSQQFAALVADLITARDAAAPRPDD
jgi:hypothetical protein